MDGVTWQVHWPVKNVTLWLERRGDGIFFHESSKTKQERKTNVSKQNSRRILLDEMWPELCLANFTPKEITNITFCEKSKTKAKQKPKMCRIRWTDAGRPNKSFQSLTIGSKISRDTETRGWIGSKEEVVCHIKSAVVRQATPNTNCSSILPLTFCCLQQHWLIGVQLSKDFLETNNSRKLAAWKSDWDLTHDGKFVSWCHAGCVYLVW